MVVVVVVGIMLLQCLRNGLLNFYVVCCLLLLLLSNTGGYPYLVGKFGEDIGFVPSYCEHYTAEDSACRVRTNKRWRYHGVCVLF